MAQIEARTNPHGQIRKRNVIAAMMAVFYTFGGANGYAAEAVALVIETEGEVSVEPFSEILEGQTVELARNATMRFTIYAACEEVNVRSGRVTFMRSNFRINAGRVLSRERTECPEVAAPGMGQAGGLVLRGPGAPIVCRRPGFVLTGPGATQIDTYAIQGPGFDGTPQPAGQRTLSLPEGQNLQAGGTYRISLFAEQSLLSEIELKGNGRACRPKDLTILRVK